MAQLGCEVPKKYTYFPLQTAVGMPGQIFMELSGKDYEGVSLPMEKWAETKPTTPTGVLPVAEMADGSFIVESQAIARVIAAATGNLGEGSDFMMSEMLAGMNADLNKSVMAIAPTMFTVSGFDDAKKKTFEEKKPDVIAFLAKYEKFLKGDKFTSTGMTFGEIDLFCKLHTFSGGALPEVITGALGPFYNRIKAVPAVKKLLDGETKFGKLAPYMVPLP
eukprot:TRINITY_DN741_c0_g1_i1.p1 TRINITY_DN741_c0_g1~~TRINITY_DN741_c0_g1_i1.p1  ORF type:complete len:248 (-),score=87.37 TRINITY_DN741_c0_g1_i1:179-838(-)